jgi:hypothetical protein
VLANALSEQMNDLRQTIARAKQRQAQIVSAGTATEWRNPTTETVVAHPSHATIDSEIETATAELARLTERHAAIMAARWRGLSDLEHWLLNASGPFELAEPVKVPKGATLAKARARLDEIAVERRAVESAPLPKSDAVTAIRAQVAALATPMEAFGALRGQPLKIPTLTTRPQLFGAAGDQRVTGFASTESVNTLGLIAWLFEAEIVERLAEQLDDQVEGELTTAQREARLAELDAEKLEVERIEEALLGGELRRPNADPRAVLGLA